MKNRINESWDLEFTAPGDLSSGDIIDINDTIGVVQDDVLSGEIGRAQTSGKFELAKNTGVAIAEGEVVYWDSTPGEVTNVSLSNRRLGTAAKAAATADTRVRVNLNHQETLTGT